MKKTTFYGALLCSSFLLASQSQAATQTYDKNFFNTEIKPIEKQVNSSLPFEDDGVEVTKFKAFNGGMHYYYTLKETVSKDFMENELTKRMLKNNLVQEICRQDFARKSLKHGINSFFHYKINDLKKEITVEITPKDCKVKPLKF